MTLPSQKDIRVPLLQVIAEAGGELRMSEAIDLVEKHFPELTAEDKQVEHPSGGLAWSNRVQWVRQHLVIRGYLYREPRGIWRISPEGREHLLRQGQLELPVRTVGPSKEKTAPEKGLHTELQDMLVEIGAILNYDCGKEFSEPPHRYDVVWKEFSGAARASIVFEVQDKGNLTEALAKLQHAKDAWNSRLFLVVTGERDQHRVHQLVGPLLSGTFHRLARQLVVLTTEQVQSLHGALDSNRELLSRLLQA